MKVDITLFWRITNMIDVGMKKVLCVNREDDVNKCTAIEKFLFKFHFVVHSLIPPFFKKKKKKQKQKQKQKKHPFILHQ